MKGKFLRFFSLFALLIMVSLIGPSTAQAATNGFKTVSGKTYYYKNGKIQYGWQTISGKKYYFNPKTGVMTTGWMTTSKGQKYYFYTKSGIMATGYVKNSKGQYYYFKPSTGIMTTGFMKDSNGKTRYFYTGSGIMATGWVKNGKGQSRYFYTNNGVMATGWVKNSKGQTRYFYTGSGIMATGFVKNSKGDTRYFYSNTGIMALGWVKNSKGQSRYFYSGSGIMATGWVKNGKGQSRYFDTSTGIMKTGWQTICKKQYYFDTSGIMKTGWVKLSGESYYFDADTGVLAVSTWVDSDHYVGSNGAYIPGYSSQDFIWPLDSQWKTLSSYFGNRSSPGGIGSTNHKGIDIPATTNTPVYAIEDGTVVGKQTEAQSGGAGNYLMINHGKGIISEYMHLNKFVSTIKVGDSVKKGQVIGYVGSTGNSTGPHLHLGIIVNGTRRDPLNYVTIPDSE